MAQKAESLFFVSEFAQRKFDAIAARSEDWKRPKARVLAEYLAEEEEEEEERRERKGRKGSKRRKMRVGRGGREKGEKRIKKVNLRLEN